MGDRRTEGLSAGAPQTAPHSPGSSKSSCKSPRPGRSRLEAQTWSPLLPPSGGGGALKHLYQHQGRQVALGIYLLCFVWFSLFRAAPAAYGNSQARGRSTYTTAQGNAGSLTR